MVHIVLYKSSWLEGGFNRMRVGTGVRIVAYVIIGLSQLSS